MAKPEEQKERKNATWTYNFNTHNLSVTFPNDQRANFDLSALTTGMTQQQEIIYQYGVKQLFASNWAAEKVVADKIDSANADYEDLIAGHATLFGEGKIGFIGRTRANSAPRTIDKAVDVKLTSLTKEQCESLLMVADAGIAPISAEMRQKLNDRIKELTN